MVYDISAQTFSSRSVFMCAAVVSNLYAPSQLSLPAKMKNRTDETMKIYEKLKQNTGKFSIYNLFLKSAAHWKYCVIGW